MVDGDGVQSIMKSAFGSRLRYPNPFQPAGIEFDLPSVAMVSLVIFDDSGREVKTLINNEQFVAGSHQCVFDAREFGDGTYFYRLSAEVQDTGNELAPIRSFVDVKRL